ncbi:MULTISPECIES: metallophosphoesterase family protein [unclassified Niallia]|uniref:metallophosphoesterase family protein n=1 Tax=unclassified Niallia TaxID=2837522 RepID=UPI0030F7D9DA
MIFTILHISDIHFKNEHNSLEDKLDKFYRSVISNLRDSDYIVCCVTGDIAYSGLQDQYYNKAFSFFDNLKQEIYDELNKEVEFLFIPGNHDCDFSNKEFEKPRKILIEDVRKKKDSPIEESIIKMIKQQKYFEEFKEIFHQDWKNCKLVYKNELFEKVTLILENKKICFNLINNSWISELQENPGKMIFPINMLDSIEDNLGDVNITLIHHPDNWLDPDNRKAFRKSIENSSDIILSGHEHAGENSTVEYWNKRKIQYHEGGALQENWDDSISSYNVIHFNLENQHQKVVCIGWKGDIYSRIMETDWENTLQYNHSVKGNNSEILEPTDRYLNQINNLQIPLTHPRVEDVSISDIYVYPHMKELLYQEKNNEVTSQKNADHILSELNTSTHFFITGEKESGKTTLSKKYFNEFYQLGYYPLLIDGQGIKPALIKDMIKLLKEPVWDTYGKSNYERYLQLKRNDRVLIIDNWQKAALNDKLKTKFLEYANKWFNNIVFFSDSVSNIKEMLQLRTTTIENLKIRQFKLSEFGYVKRAELIGKWVKLGQEESLNEEQEIRIIDQFEKMVNSVIGSNYIPTFPLYILVMLQTFESGKEHNLDKSTNGYYYEVLIKQALMKIQIQNKDIETMNNYLTELAFYFYKFKLKKIKPLEWDKFHDKYRLEYDLTNEQLPFTIYKQKLLGAKILESHNDGFRFSYSYIYYYFIAQYLAKNVKEEEEQKIIANLCKNLYVEKNANILMFLVHLSKDSSIMFRVKEAAKGIFESLTELRLDEDVSIINDFMDSIPAMVIHDIDVKTNRYEVNKSADNLYDSKIDESEDDFNEESEEDVENHQLQIINEMNKAFKMIELIGQILKNYYGSMKGEEKKNLCSEAFTIGLRTANSIIGDLKNNKDSLIEFITDLIISKEGDANLSNEEITKRSKRILYNMSKLVISGTIMKVSLSVGSKELDETLRKVEDVLDINSARLINAAIKLEHYDQFPYDDIKNLYKLLNDNKIGQDLLRDFVKRHLYMFKTDFKEQQKICSSVGIQYKPQSMYRITTAENSVLR